MKVVSDVAILVVAAGRGARAGGEIPKQYSCLAGKPMLTRTLDALMRSAPGASVLPVIHKDALELYRNCAGYLNEARGRLLDPVFGGSTRQESVRNGLEALSRLPSPPEIVLIHDAARLFVTNELIQRAIGAAKTFGAAIPGISLTDTIKEIDADAKVIVTVPRERLRSVQTPQSFRFGLIWAAHLKAAAAGVLHLTDDAAIAEFAGHPVHVFAGDDANMKVTTSEDLASAEARLIAGLADIRIGQGYDVHAFGPGSHLWLGGVKIEHDRGLVGHSDADVLSHAIADALFGALADGDIGSHFPPSDPRWRGAASRIFLAAAAEKVRARDGVIAHIDATVICERPKLAPHRDAIRGKIAETVDIPIDRVAVKATTSEGLGFTGREEGIASLAVATIRLPV
ncbi:MAG: bifunctional 2-C-methyl-D-erythritol 4-phosphate cytidylyltransferase/2-C-methyl-D-erythritol 2,4-cyclodiphosphate synthase [Beijerinckiaceae bacterium]|nr:bifunctional 2-C-methyl-D-erythritol 4-phosphate cytidylyltransferase/2-C-methyl-D-erythritol 2,4-cyclodiphosphate synthase [Beijerinckiaceae bacterium]